MNMCACLVDNMYYIFDLLSIAEDVQQRWKVLRDRFVRELKKKQPTGCAAKTSSDWEPLEYMIFLRDSIKHRRYQGTGSKLDSWVS